MSRRIKPLLAYIVIYNETPDQKEPSFFRAWAENVDHAVEQCVNAEPEANVLSAVLVQDFLAHVGKPTIEQCLNVFGIQNILFDHNDILARRPDLTPLQAMFAAQMVMSNIACPKVEGINPMDYDMLTMHINAVEKMVCENSQIKSLNEYIDVLYKKAA